MTNTQRACDRCRSLKTQCNRAKPCSRCVRLGISCNYKLPVRRRGRPKRSETNADTRRRHGLVKVLPLVTINPSPELSPPATNSHNTQISEQLFGEQIDYSNAEDEYDGDNDDGEHVNDEYADEDSMGLLLGIPDDSNITEAPGGHVEDDVRFPKPSSQDIQRAAHINAATARRLLQYFACPEDLGIFGMLPPLSMPSETTTDVMIPDEQCPLPLELYAMLLAAGLQLESGRSSLQEQDDRELLIDTLRIESLRQIPALSWKSVNINVFQCISLVIGSHMWSFNADLANIADRWSSMAMLIWEELRRTAPILSPGLLERAGKAIYIQSISLNFLHHRSSSTLSKELCKFGELALRELESTRPASITVNKPSFFALMCPLTRCLEQILRAAQNADVIASVQDQLELYYLHFPPSLLAYQSLQYVYEAECMVWFHGLFIMSEISWDITDLFVNENWPSTNSYYVALEHSLLLGEVLPTLSRLDSSGQSLSAVTVLLIILSSTVTAMAIWQFHEQVEQTQNTIIKQDPPFALITCAHWHLAFLDVLLQSGGRFESDIVRSVNTLLSSVMKGITSDMTSLIQSALVNLAHYRWDNDSYGISRLPDDVVQSKKPTLTTIRLPVAGSAIDCEQRRDAIRSLVMLGVRACQQGYFDLSIRIL